VQTPVFWLFFLAFAIKLPLMPFHTWQASAYASAPIPIAVLLAAVMGKVGAYGFIRLNVGLLPQAAEQQATLAGTLAVLGIIIGAMIAAAQKDLKRLIAYSSLAHLGFIALGIFAATNVSVAGAIIQMVNHGITTAALLMLVGWLVLHSGTNRIDDHGGIFSKAPVLGGIFLYTVMASIAVPGLNGFPGEFSIMVGSYGVLPRLTAVAATGVILAAVYFLWAYQRAFFGPVRGASEHMGDLTGPQRYLVYPLVILMLIFGLYPAPLFDVVNPAVDHLLGATAPAATQMAPEQPTEGN
ncbi:NADH-quinone oxidoreductase subunit M, partial [Stomatohabitans albus]